MRIIKKVILIAILLPFGIHADKRISTIIIPHSQSINAARELAGWENQVNIYTENGTHGSIAINPEFTLSFRADRIAQCFFGDAIIDCKNTFTVSGSQTERADSHWLADYFGLPTDFASYVSFCPRISNAIFDIDLFVGFTKFIPGLYFRVHAPLVHTSWKLGMCETLITTGSNAHEPGYFNESGIPRSQLVDNFTQFITGQDAPKGTELTFHKLEHAKMSYNSEGLTNLSDIQLAICWNVLHNKRYHLGGNIRISIPTGNCITGTLLFEPIVGNTHHWELGGGLSTHIIVWEDEETQEHFGLYLDLNITHMFSTIQHRSFDLCTKHNSRYMLAQRMGSDIEYNLRGVVDGERITPTFQYKKEVTPVANLTTLPIQVEIGVQADLALLLNYTAKQNSFSIGYGFWGRSCEKIQFCTPTSFDTAQWALKGDAHVFGFENNASQTAIPLSATQSEATIHRGLNFPKSGAVTNAEIATGKTNPNIDNPALAVSDSESDGSFVSVQSEVGGSNQINSSIQPILLTTADIDIDSARTKGIAHKIFSHYSRTLVIKSFLPYLGFGAEIEFGPQAYCPKAICLKEPECVNTAISFWGIWIKGGVAF